MLLTLCLPCSLWSAFSTSLHTWIVFHYHANLVTDGRPHCSHTLKGGNTWDIITTIPWNCTDFHLWKIKYPQQPIRFLPLTGEGAAIRQSREICRQKDGGMQRETGGKERMKMVTDVSDGWWRKWVEGVGDQQIYWLPPLPKLISSMCFLKSYTELSDWSSTTADGHQHYHATPPLPLLNVLVAIATLFESSLSLSSKSK